MKVLYIDTDNMSNIVTTSQTFSETFADNSITVDSVIILSQANIIDTILSQDGTLKLNLNVNYTPTMYINLALPNVSGFENMIVKKREVSTSSIVGQVNSQFEYLTNIETKDNITKILGYDCSFAKSKATSYEEHAVIEGKLYSTLLYETDQNGSVVKKEIKDTFNVKLEVPISSLTPEYSLDIVCLMDKSKETINTEIEDDNTIVSIEHHFVVRGVIIKNISLDMLEDMYSTDNEIELHTTSREYNTNIIHEHVSETISGEITLDNEEPAIDEIVSNHNISTEITNYYVKNESLYLEGIVTSHIVYIDENKECRHKQTELPFIINTKINLEHIDCLHYNVNAMDCRAKVKRGTIIELEYTLALDLCIYIRETTDVIDNLTIGKAIDFSMYDYQIFIAKPDETIWDLAKRIKISPEKLTEMNRNLPLIMQGNEKIIIKR